MLREDYEGNRHIGHGDGGDVFRVDLLQAFKPLPEGEGRNFKHFHSAECSEVEDLQAVMVGGVSDQGEGQGNQITGDDAEDEGNQFEHLLAFDREEDNGEQGDHRANQICPQG